MKNWFLILLLSVFLGSSALANTEVSETVNINTATIEQLETLQGVGSARAMAIVNYREQYGTFKSVEEITSVSGIGETIYSQNRERMVVE